MVWIDAVRIDTKTMETVEPIGGFGFIVGERDRKLYVVSASHIVHYAGMSGRDSIVVRRVKFFTGTSKAASLRPEQSTALDLAILTVEKPKGFEWRRACLGSGEVTDQKVWYVGRDSTWHVNSVPGQVNRKSEEASEIYIENLPLKDGTSGAPVVTANGIIGMVKREGALESRATLVDGIKGFAIDHKLPWDLKRFKSRPWRSTLLAAVATGAYLAMGYVVDKKWDDYEGDPLHPPDLYDSYKNWNRGRQIVGATAIAAGVWASVGWVRYWDPFGGDEEQANDSASEGNTDTRQLFKLTLSYRF